MIERRSLRGLSVAGTAAAGVVVGHWLAYLAAIPAHAARAQTLAGTGHAYWSGAVKFAVVLVLAGFGALALRHLGNAPDPDSPRVLRFSWTARRLAAVQTVLFIAMETVERIFAGSPVGSMFAHHLFFVGVATQLLVAFAAALILVLLDRGARALMSALRRVRPRRVMAGAEWTPLSAPPPRPALVAGAAGLRGPPSF